MIMMRTVPYIFQETRPSLGFQLFLAPKWSKFYDHRILTSQRWELAFRIRLLHWLRQLHPWIKDV